jgi:hypothetical protein
LGCRSPALLFAYGAASRVTQITDQVGGVVRQKMTYNAAGQIATLADGNGHALTYLCV